MTPTPNCMILACDLHDSYARDLEMQVMCTAYASSPPSPASQKGSKTHVTAPGVSRPPPLACNRCHPHHKFVVWAPPPQVSPPRCPIKVASLQ